jgi:hypothetical protein
MASYKVTSTSGRSAVVEASSEEEARILALKQVPLLGSNLLQEEPLEIVCLELSLEAKRREEGKVKPSPTSGDSR